MLKWFHRSTVPVLTVLAVLVANQGFAQATAQQPRHFLMWKVSSPTANVYLVGSIHVGDASMYPLPGEVESAFAGSKVLGVEINVKDFDQSKSVGLIQQYGTYDGGDALSQHLPKEVAVALDSYCDKLRIPRASLELFKPWVVAVTLVALSYQQAGEDPKLGIDLHFLNEVKPPQRIDELESFDFQLKLFADATEQEQLELLADSLKEADKVKDLIARIQDAYLAGDGEKLSKLIQEENTGPKSLMKKLLDDRNISMAGKVEEYLKGKDQCFVVVGAAHLVGDKGVVKLLQGKGYKVAQVSSLH